jgi:hypothetical protein
MNAYIWRTAAGSNKFVCSYTGSDWYGNGTQAKPYKSLTKAYNSGSATATIICRGIFNDNLIGAHNSSINADYFGAAVWDGQGTNNIYAFMHQNMIFINGGAAVGYVGVGIGSPGYSVGNASWVLGLSGSPALVYNCQLYLAVVGGSANVKYTVYASIPASTDYLVSLGSQGVNQNITIHGIPKASMRKSISWAAVKGPNLIYSLISATAIYLDQYGTFTKCMFASDCTFWETDTQFTPTGATDADKMQSIVDKVATLGAIKLILTSCKYTSQTASELFNNPAKLDFTLKPGCDAIEDLDAYNGITYYGALKPALNVPIMDDSSGEAGTWDENTATGDITVSSSAINFNAAGTNALSEIYSKVVAINPQTTVLDGLKALFLPVFNQKLYMDDRILVDNTHITAGATLAIGQYIVKLHAIVYGAATINIDEILVVASAGTSFSFEGGDTTAYVLAINDPNVWNPVYVRQQNVIYATVAVGGALQSGGVYLNYGNENITYRTRTIAPGESFMAVNSSDTFTGTAGYLIGIVFNDSRVPVSEWMSLLTYMNGIGTTGTLTAVDGFWNLVNGGAQVYTTVTGYGTVTTNKTTSLSGVGTTFLTTFKAGDTITVSGETARIVDTVSSDTSLTVTVAFSNTASAKSYTHNRVASSGTPEAYAQYATYARQLMNKQYLQFKVMLRKYDV